VVLHPVLHVPLHGVKANVKNGVKNQVKKGVRRRAVKSDFVRWYDTVRSNGLRHFGAWPNFAL
jgi:hypothetical protein